MQASSTIETDAPRGGRSAWSGDLGLAVAGAAASLALSFLSGANKLNDSAGDSDSLMRLVQIRDLLGGQGWFDLTQYRMGPAGGFEMHWSRLVDAPVAALIWLAGLVTGDNGLAETIVAWLWPGILLATCLALLVRAARNLGGSEAAFPAAVLGLAALHFMGIFAPGSFDHHNVQLALILAAVAALTGQPSSRKGLLAGLAAAASLAVGMETAPLVAAVGVAVALTFLIGGEAERRSAAGYGLGFAGAAMLISLVTLPATQWSQIACDAWSGAQAGTALLAGLGLAATAAIPQLSRTFGWRLACLTALAVAAATLSVTAFPACFADPYAGLDPLLRQYWLDWVTEAQGVLSLLFNRPGEAAGYYVTPLLALAFLAWLAVRHGVARSALAIGLPLAVALAVSLWQVRGAMFSVPLAIIPLAALVARTRTFASDRSGIAPALMLVLAWLASFNIAWNLGVTRISGLMSVAPSAVSENAASADPCYATVDYAALAELPPATVLAISNLGAPILFNTGHRVLSGPYHRNVEGNLAALRALTARSEDARSIIDGNDVNLIAHCAGNSETKVLAAQFPQSLVADIENDQLPPWLDRLEVAGPLQLFRLRQ